MRMNTLKDRIANWEILQTNVKPQLAESPQLTNDLTQLERVLADAKALEADRGGHVTALAASARERQALVDEGDAVFRRLTLALRAKFGPKSEKLFTYGVVPEKTRRRKATTVKAPPVVAPAGAKAAEAAEDPSASG